MKSNQPNINWEKDARKFFDTLFGEASGDIVIEYFKPLLAQERRFVIERVEEMKKKHPYDNGYLDACDELLSFLQDERGK